MQRVAIVGASGKMGTAATQAIGAAQDLSLVALVDPTEPVAPPGARWVAAIEDLDPAGLDVVVDVSVAAAARRTIAWVAEHGASAVIGTSGLSDEDLRVTAQRAARSGARILVVPNFSIGAVLVARFAAQAAPYFESVEVIELHHDRKRDAPSGTSIATARAIAEARTASGAGAPADPTTTETLEGARGALGAGGIRIHSVRLPGLLAHQEVHFGAPGEGLVLRHDTYDRESFMAGLLLSVRGIGSINGVAVGLDAVLAR